MPTIVDLLLTTDPRQRLRLAQAGLALVMMAAGIFAMHLGAGMGIVDPHLGWWTAISAAGFIVVAVAIRAGLTRHLADPSLTLVQMVHGTACAAWAYALAGSAHATTPLVMTLILMFGMFGMTTRQVLWVALYATALFGGVMFAMVRADPAHYHAPDDLMLFVVMLTIISGIVILTGRLHRIRDRMKRQRAELEDALAEIRRLATHDDLTGLVNRRHLQALLEDERARHQRDRLPWCVALIDLDHFKRINDRHGHAVGDDALRALGRRAAGLIRQTDTLGRWGGEEFVLLLPGTSLDTARVSLDRVREDFAQHPLAAGEVTITLSFSAGVTEHRSGESVAQTLERADRLAYRAKDQGRNRIEAG